MKVALWIAITVAILSAIFTITLTNKDKKQR